MNTHISFYICFFLFYCATLDDYECLEIWLIRRVVFCPLYRSFSFSLLFSLSFLSCGPEKKCLAYLEGPKLLSLLPTALHIPCVDELFAEHYWVTFSGPSLSLSFPLFLPLCVCFHNLMPSHRHSHPDVRAQEFQAAQRCFIFAF